MSLAEDLSEERFLVHVAELRAAAPSLTPVGAGILVALHFGICRDSRTFARLFGIAHAIVLREVTELADGRGHIAILDRNARSQRSVYALTGTGRDLMARSVAAAPARAPDSRPAEMLQG